PVKIIGKIRETTQFPAELAHVWNITKLNVLEIQTPAGQEPPVLPSKLFAHEVKVFVMMVEPTIPARVRPKRGAETEVHQRAIMPFQKNQVSSRRARNGRESPMGRFLQVMFHEICGELGRCGCSQNVPDLCGVNARSGKISQKNVKAGSFEYGNGVLH